MPLAYYSRSATTEFWTEHWGGHTVDELLRIARESPLTELIERHLPAAGRLLEAGCGLGQYVLLFRERGRAAVGADWSQEALRAGAGLGAPLAAMDLRALAVVTGGIAAYLSLGVVEHDPDGPDAILREAARVVPFGGALLLSVPYWNGVRRLATPYLRRQARRTREAGGQFYQYAFTRRELSSVRSGAGAPQGAASAPGRTSAAGGRPGVRPGLPRGRRLDPSGWSLRPSRGGARAALLGALAAPLRPHAAGGGGPALAALLYCSR